MNWLKLFRYDLRSGILRWRYLCVPVIFFLPCFYGWFQISDTGCAGTWMDYLMCCFKGVAPLSGGMEGFEFPILWFLVMGGCLYLNLDYPLNDLTEEGQQVIIRAVSKKSWFFSKCAWNLLSSTVYFLLGILTVLVFTLACGGSTGLTNTPEISMHALQIYTSASVNVWQAVLAVVVLPWLTMAALNMLQMTLSLVMKPIFGFLVCICLLTVSLFTNSPIVLGNGAMVARSGIFVEGSLNPAAVALVCAAFLGLSIIVGIIRFDRMDHLRYEG